MTHGTRASYVKGCKCAPCRAANARYAKLAKYRADKGITVLVDAGPVKAHLAQLRAAGVGKRTIAAQAGVAQTAVDRLLGINTTRPAMKVRPETAKRLLAVTPDDRADGAFVPMTGTRRRLQALVALGWPQAHLARLIGWTPNNLGKLIHHDHKVTVATATLVADLYTQLSMQPGPSRSARRTAQRKGWVPPLAWTDIDDARSRPAYLRQEAS